MNCSAEKTAAFSPEALTSCLTPLLLPSETCQGEVSTEDLVLEQGAGPAVPAPVSSLGKNGFLLTADLRVESLQDGRRQGGGSGSGETRHIPSCSGHRPTWRKAPAATDLKGLGGGQTLLLLASIDVALALGNLLKSCGLPSFTERQEGLGALPKGRAGGATGPGPQPPGLSSSSSGTFPTGTGDRAPYTARMCLCL